MGAVKVTLGGKACIAEGSNYFELEPGVMPSAGVVTMWDRDAEELQKKDTGHELVIQDGNGGEVKLPNLYILRIQLIDVAVIDPKTIGQAIVAKSSSGGSGVATASGGTKWSGPGGGGGATSSGSTSASSNKKGGNKKVSNGTGIVQVYLVDARSKWRYKEITGFYNVLKDDGINYRASTVNSTTPFTFDELLQKCIDAIGITLTANTGIDWTPQNIRWEFTNAAVAMGALLENVGWTIAWNPDFDTFKLIDLADPPQSYAEKSGPGVTVVGYAEQGRDWPHEKPETAQVAFRIMRQKHFTFEAVIQHDGLDQYGNSLSTAKDGEWQPVATVLSDWGTDTGTVNKAYYGSLASTANPATMQLFANDPKLARQRLRRIHNQYYRCFRLNSTDRETVLPLLPVLPEVQSATGREIWLGAKPHTGLSYHLPRYENAQKAYFINITALTSAAPFDVQIVDPADGVVAVDTGKLPLCPVKQRGGTLGYMAQDYVLEPSTVSFVIGYMKKFSDTSDFTSDYHLVSRTISGDTNGETKTFLSPQVFLREIFENGDFTKANQTEIEQIANDFLDRYNETFKQPAPQEWVYAGIPKQYQLTQDIRGIRWDASDGVTTQHRLYTPFSFNPISVSPAARDRRFALQAESAVLLDPSSLAGKGGNHDLGSLDNLAPILKEHSVMQRNLAGHQFETNSFINDMTTGLLVASDRTMPVSGEDPCKQPGTSGQRPTQTTRSPQRSGGVQISGGPSDK